MEVYSGTYNVYGYVWVDIFEFLSRPYDPVIQTGPTPVFVYVETEPLAIEPLPLESYASFIEPVQEPLLYQPSYNYVESFSSLEAAPIITAVPEPSSVFLLGMGVLTFFVMKKFFKNYY